MGLIFGLGIEMYETANYPTRIQFDNLKGKNVVDFDLAENTGVFLTGFYFSLLIKSIKMIRYK